MLDSCIFLINSYHHEYVGQNGISFWYYCSQRDNLAAKPRKHPDPLKHSDTPSMERFTCNGLISSFLITAIFIGTNPRKYTQG